MTEENGEKWAVTFFVDCGRSGCFYRAFMARVIREIQVSKASKLLPRYCIYYMFPSFSSSLSFCLFSLLPRDLESYLPSVPQLPPSLEACTLAELHLPFVA